MLCAYEDVLATVCIKLLLARVLITNDTNLLNWSGEQTVVGGSTAPLFPNYMFIATRVTNRTCVLCERRIITPYLRVHDAMLTQAIQD